MYFDEKFGRLSGLRPSGQALWVYLLTGPHTGPIPGVFVAGRAGLSEALEWDPEDFEKALVEVTGQGLIEFDAKARLWFISNAIKHNMPPNPNVVKSWRVHWNLLPECDLRARIQVHLRSAMYGVSKNFGMAFDEACGKASAKPLAKSSAKQEAGVKRQEAGPTEVERDGESERSFELFWAAWPKHHRKAARAQCLSRWKAKNLHEVASQIIGHVQRLKQSNEWRKDSGQYVPAPLTYLNQGRWEAPLVTVTEATTTAVPDAEATARALALDRMHPKTPPSHSVLRQLDAITKKCA
jgi:hypothetical protein